MARHTAIEEHLAEAAGWQAAGAHDRAAERAAAGLAQAPDAPELLRLLLRAELSRGALDAARDAAGRLAALTPQGRALDLLVETALDLGQGQTARTLLAGAEADGTAAPAQAAQLKARIAMAAGDLLAAKAILVTAIEAAPDLPALRALLAEVMVAAGTAADARAVLTHVGQPPVNPAPPPDDAGATEDTGATADDGLPDSRIG
ncbi:tetratricopeptide repeat protein [Roseicyclus persicicus]|uniref:Tetratricopeptide repeat protein n=1 Tax=Roseicyclus persicicus TaxID=2650661 RepID=A0A7X6GYP5_9RHOB|nr:tetratricopeptide repeat protein [Roseibacterium persicicum]NKX44793.1 tetratricopeptide repeat protein [Roseibacterium persicicum]